MRPRVVEAADLLESHREVEVRVGERGIVLERVAKPLDSLLWLSILEREEAEVVVRFGLRRLDRERFLVEGSRLVDGARAKAKVADVGERVGEAGSIASAAR